MPFLDENEQKQKETKQTELQKEKEKKQKQPLIIEPVWVHVQILHQYHNDIIYILIHMNYINNINTYDIK